MVNLHLNSMKPSEIPGQTDRKKERTRQFNGETYAALRDDDPPGEALNLLQSILGEEGSNASP